MESRATKSDRRVTEHVGRIELHCAGVLWAAFLPDVVPTWDVETGNTVELIAAVAMITIRWLPRTKVWMSDENLRGKGTCERI